MARLTLNSLSSDIFKVNASETADGKQARADIVGAGRLLTAEHAKKGKIALNKAMNIVDNGAYDAKLSGVQYKELNERFQAEHLLYAANQVCAFTGEKAPENFEEFRRQGQRFYGDTQFYKVLQGIYQEIITPILPAVYSEAVSAFADVVEVGFAETYALSIGSNDIPVFQDAAWGATRSVPRNRFYSKDYTLNPQPKTAWITAKWTQLIGNGMDFGAFFANIAAGMYAKTMGMWNAALTAAASDTTKIPSGLSYTFSAENWVTLANKIAAVNNTSISNVMGFGGAVALAKILPTQVTGATNVNMDAAIATLLGADYVRTGYLGEYMAVRLMPLQDVVIPGTQNGNVTTMLADDQVWLMAGNGRKPMTIAYNRETPITITMDPRKTADFEIGMNLTIALDAVSIFSSKVGLITIE